VHAGGDGGQGVAARDVVRGVVDQDVGAAQCLLDVCGHGDPDRVTAPRDPEVLAGGAAGDGADQLQVRRAQHRLGDRPAGPPGRPGDRHPRHAGHASDLIE